MTAISFRHQCGNVCTNWLSHLVSHDNNVFITFKFLYDSQRFADNI